MKARTFAASLVALCTVLGSCSQDDPSPYLGPPLAKDGAPAVSVVLPPEAAQRLRDAAEDFNLAVKAITEVEADVPVIFGGVQDASTDAVVAVTLDPAADGALGPEGYRLVGEEHGSGKKVLRITAATDTGAMYGLYRVLGDMGVRYIHPEQTVYPAFSAAVLPFGYTGAPDVPAYAVRGFHEHTQHPTVFSDFYLRPEPEFRPYLSRYIRWLARNRQNFMSFQLLKTIDLPTWSPYIAEVIDEAHSAGLQVGVVLSFVDEQQNNFKIIRPDRTDDEGQPVDDEAQIALVLEHLAELGFDTVVLQLGSSEFTKVDDADLLRWLDRALAVLTPLGVQVHAWIHPLCALESDSGGYFYQVPMKAGAELGAWVHTTMFYDLEHPAPVYGCQDFGHQLDFLEQQDGKRPQVYFPETAWWLGFDNNLPLALPLTGWSRAYDLQQVLPSLDLLGHVTFTTGREWGYWKYDHYLTLATWDPRVSWSGYLQWLAPALGFEGQHALQVLDAWTELQRQHFYEENPYIYFYLSGELAQDELGQSAGIMARPPKVAFTEVLKLEDEAFAAWRTADLEMLDRMHQAYGGLLALLPEPSPSSADLSSVLYHELVTTLRIFVLRIEHARALYQGVEEARRWAHRSADDAGLRQEAEAAARARLTEARGITERVRKLVEQMEGYYRYPLELLAREKPESLTVYPYGHLHETATVHFWSRRDEQLAALLNQVFTDVDESWEQPPDALFVTGSAHAELMQPDNAVVAMVIEGFIPQLLFGLSGDPSQGEEASLTVGHDYNENLLPDAGTELTVPLDTRQSPFTGTVDAYTLVVRSSTGERLGDGLTLHDPLFTVTVKDDPQQPSLPLLERCLLEGDIATAQLVSTVVAVAGIDAEGAESLVRNVFEVPEGEPTPERLRIAVVLSFERAASL